MPLLTTNTGQRCLIVLLLALLPAGLALGQDKYQLTMKRDRPVGSQYAIKVQGEQTRKQSQSVDGNEVASETFAFLGSLNGVAEVLTVHKSKEVSSVAIKIEKFSAEHTGEKINLDLDKRIIAKVVRGDTQFAYEDGTPLGDKATQVLDMLTAFMLEEDPQGPTDDELYKLNQPRAKGTKWACNNELLASDLSKGGELIIKKDGIESQFSFIDIAQFAGKDAAVFDVTVKMNDVTLPGAKEGGLTVVKSGGQMQLSGLMPLDPTSSDGAVQMQVKMGITAQAQHQGKTVQVSFDINAQADAEFKRIK